MKNNDIAVIMSSDLFRGVGEKETESMLGCLSAERKEYEKGSYIYQYGDMVDAIGLVTEGTANVINEDYWGNRNIVAVIQPGETFAESYAGVGIPIGVSVQCLEKTQVIFLNIRKVLTTCSSACAFHTRLIQNLITLLASKNLLMNEKLTYLTRRNTRDKLLAYLSTESMKKKSASFSIPFDRQQLADFLSVDRSAMSGELSRMQKEGIISYKKNQFTLCTSFDERD